MIRSVGVGGSNVSGHSLKKPQQSSQTPFPKLNGKGDEQQQQTVSSETPIMVGVKRDSSIRSIMQDAKKVVQLNADGDRLEVSKHAIELANQYFSK